MYPTNLYHHSNQHIRHTEVGISIVSSRLGLGASISHNNLMASFQHFPVVETVQESVAIRSARLLKPILGVDTWSNGRRYLIAPAALAACPLTVLTTLSGRAEDVLTAEQGASRLSAFGTIVLGEAVLSYVGANANTYNVNKTTQTVQRWSSACLVLRQNLPEYDNLSAVRGLPCGFCHCSTPMSRSPGLSGRVELHFTLVRARADKRLDDLCSNGATCVGKKSA
jgi:hypothetical protein